MHNSISLDKLKSKDSKFTTLADFFKREWPQKEAYHKAREHFGMIAQASFCVLNDSLV